MAEEPYDDARPAAGGENLKQFSPHRVLLPVLLGLGFVCYVVYHELLKNGLTVGDLFAQMDWTAHTFLWLGLGVLMVATRELGYTWQLRILTDRKISRWACFEIVMLWNFFGAVSPSMVGGTPMAVFMLNKEGISLGRSTAIVFTILFFDQVFYSGIPLLVSLMIPQQDIFAPLDMIKSDVLGTSVYSAFCTAWVGIAAYVAFLVAALFVAPRWINWWLVRLFMLPFLRRWRVHGLHLAEELLLASHDLRGRHTLWWLRAWLATTVAWLGRYLVLICVLLAFADRSWDLFSLLLAAGRQAVLYIIMTLSPTPGGAGIAEMGFTWLFKDLVPAGLALSLAIVWRLLAYYPYLLLGIPIMTRWIKRVYGRDVRERL